MSRSHTSGSHQLPAYQCLQVQGWDSAIITVQFNRQDKRNSLSADMMAELTDFAVRVRSIPTVRAVILRGTDHFFSSGADLFLLDEIADRPAEDIRDLLRAGPDMCRAWEDIEAITIAAIEGYCVGGAVSLALACDFRIGGAEAMMRLPEVPLGMNMSWQTLPRLTTLIGPSRAKQMAIFGDPIQADRLHDWGLIDQTVEAGDALKEAQNWAERLSALPPIPVRMTKSAVNASANALHQTSSFMDRDQFMLTLLSGSIQSGRER